MPLSGHCLCGQVRFEIDAPLEAAGYCHCTRCQRRSGTAASANAAIKPGSLKVTAGAELIADYAPDDGFVKSFCSHCGSALWSSEPVKREIKGVRLGALDGDPGVRPSFRKWLNSAAVWEAVPDDGLEHRPGA